LYLRLRVTGEKSTLSDLGHVMMKERYLEVLYVYGHLGLTLRELYEKRFNWLWHPSDVLRKNRCVMTTYRIKTISTFLNRLKREGLTCRKKRVEHTAIF
jgi:hypothetical protein